MPVKHIKTLAELSLWFTKVMKFHHQMMMKTVLAYFVSSRGVE